MTYLKIEFCGVAGYYRCDLSQATSPLESWNGTDWVGTQYQCADCRHRRDLMLDLAFELEARENEIAEDEFEADYKFVDNFDYRVSAAD